MMQKGEQLLDFRPPKTKKLTWIPWERAQANRQQKGDRRLKETVHPETQGLIGAHRWFNGQGY